MGLIEGGSARVIAQYTDEQTGVLVDPVTASIKVRSPGSDGQLHSYDWTGGIGDTLIKMPNTTGTFYVDLTDLEAGVYSARAESTGPDSAEEQKFPVEASRVL